MALLFCDGFGHVTATYKLAKWTSTAGTQLYASTYGRDGGWGINLSTDNGYIRKDLSTNCSTMIVGFATNFQHQYGYGECFRIYDASATQCSLRMTVGGQVSVYSGASVLLGTTGPGLWLPYTWQYWEMKVVFSQTVGSIEVRLNGVTILTVTDVDTCGGTANEYGNAIWYQSNSNIATYLDDLYVCDATGTENNDFLGDVRITELYPTSDGNSSDFTPSTGVDNYATVDDPQISISDYNDGSAIGDKDTYGMTTLTGDATIKAVQVISCVNNTTAGTINVRNISRSGTTPADNESPDFALSQTVKGLMHIFEKEPTDDVAWTVAKVNASEFGIKVES